MEIIIAGDARGVSTAAADIVTDLVRAKPNAVLGLATGSSPLGLYAELAARVVDGLDMTAVRGFALDEYVGLAPDDPRSYAHTIRTTVTEPLRLDAANVHVPSGVATDLEAACDGFESEMVRAGGVDVQILGIGRNGHLGFNEPGSAFESRTRITTLAEQTRRDNARYFAQPQDVPTRCSTQGLATIMKARTAVLIATGTAKAHAVDRALRGPVTVDCPASILQRHPSVVVVLDEDAAHSMSRDCLQWPATTSDSSTTTGSLAPGRNEYATHTRPKNR
ncbi:glucosamine-6-phosphate deaminase [Mycobacterium yunnanensis]|uniref:glucosamine-6-phosphate deaminase n=1 Tax=Mycobacterium yunnanensis TaxID=368477 RepID=UPI0021F3C0B2|nr:glucosamine-6-phosphate deaminase [Mycobacterium yunnanensis]